MSTPRHAHSPSQRSTTTSLRRRLASPQPTSSPSTTHTGISSIAHLDRGTQIGIIIGITVIAILVVIGCGLGIVGFRRRQRRRRRRLQVARDEELAVLEGEMKRHSGGGHKRGQDSGLWDNLKIRCGEEREGTRGIGASGMQRLGQTRDERGREGSEASEGGLVKPPAPVHLENVPPCSIAVGGAHT